MEEWLKYFNIPLLKSIIRKIPENTMCPKKENVFKAFKLCPLKECKVVFLGMEPYAQKDVATGILFGNSSNVAELNLSPSLKVVKEAVINPTYVRNIIFDNTLESWASQGILMLNAALTVELNRIGSHLQLWRPFMSAFLKKFSNDNTGIIFVLFGNQAQTFEYYINSKYNYIIKEKHPAFYARSGTKMTDRCFEETNNYVYKLYNEKIKWFTEL